ncbi:HEAT repeat domain-containing protein [Methylicorpusculum sp.]|uniref:HEAT repeat domain-containing protein n=1 Tax=Methylicorpusculum sp. TaxID=2713644 RepID=UPI002726659B|nr:HEAT repeat domain-containing protein [Methylicorpusculum sp.]MDO8844850.1 HEAT repeat domain-containing protein [Methylicorpusculum sp.]
MAIVKQQPIQQTSVDERQRSRDLPGLIAELEAEDPAARRWAARDLSEHPSSVLALVGRLKCENDSSVREAILTTLTCLGDKAAVAGLVECLRSEDVALRNEVIEAMKQLPEEVAPIMGELLADTDPDVRIFAVNILESLRHPLVESWLIGVIQNDSHINVCATAVDLLGEVGSSSSREALKSLKSRFPDDPYICFAADLALKRINED